MKKHAKQIQSPTDLALRDEGVAFAVSVKEAALLLSMSARTVWRRIRSKELPYRKVGGSVRILRCDLAAFIDGESN